MKPQEKVFELQKLMKDHQIEAWIVPSTDPHQSEYVAEHWKGRAWLSGFTGSAGTIVVTGDKSGLWTDPRYHLRAEQELEGSGIELFREGLPDVPNFRKWLIQELNSGDTVGFDGSVLSQQEVRKLERAFQEKDIQLNYQHDLVGQLWDDRPIIPRNPIFLHGTEFAGETRGSKFQRVREKLKENGFQAQVVTGLDEIAWLFNIRGSDVLYNPVAICYAVISEWEVRLFIYRDKVPPEVRAALVEEGIEFSEYEDIFSYWQQLPEETMVLIDPEKTSYKMERIISKSCRTKKGMSIPYLMKAVKNEVELEGLRQAHIRDGVAMVKWMYWLDQQGENFQHTEITVADKLTEFRSQGEYFQGLSFGTISAYQANSAVGHYNPQPETTPTLRLEGIFLIDSGGQYLDGTTDITRTLSLGGATDKQKQVFTRVLKGLIRLSRARFPKGVKGNELDAITREPLWQQGWNCRHGIGHGIGSYLNVHEGPQKFAVGNKTPFEPGMVATNEPGVYFPGKFGCRIENVLVTIPDEATDFGEFYGFETITLCPIDLELVDDSLLTEGEVSWLNEYHQWVFDTLSPFLSQEEKEWLEQETRSI
ncbi:MAG: aminopeptidase P family protein [Chloroflexota bacterium]|nr:MAG: aminopeptidase P family protein [Chloroflexota bacterium]